RSVTCWPQRGWVGNPVDPSRQGADGWSGRACDHVRHVESLVHEELPGFWILLVGESVEIRARLRVALTLLGAQVVAAATAWEASRLLRAGTFDAIVVDVDAPDPDGAAMLSAGAGIPAIGVTAFPGDSKPRPEATHFASFLATPVYPEGLV